MSTSTARASCRSNQTDRPRHSPLPHDKAMSFQPLHHLIHRGSRHQEVSLNVCFCRRYPKSGQILLDKLEILPLEWGRPHGSRAFPGTARRGKIDRQTLTAPLNEESRSIHKVNRKLAISTSFYARYTLPGNLSRNLIDVQWQPPSQTVGPQPLVRRHDAPHASRQQEIRIPRRGASPLSRSKR